MGLKVTYTDLFWMLEGQTGHGGTLVGHGNDFFYNYLLI